MHIHPPGMENISSVEISAATRASLRLSLWTTSRPRRRGTSTSSPPACGEILVRVTPAGPGE